MIKAIIFDLDGVLLDTEPLYTEAYQRVTMLYGKEYTWDIKSGSIGRKSIDSATRVVTMLKLPITPQEFLERRDKHLRELFENVPQMAGADILIRKLDEAAIPFALATSSPREQMVQKIEPHPCFKLFSVMWAGDDDGVHQGKPAPDIFLRAAESLHIEPKHCLVIEDSPSGVEAAHAAGMQCLAMPDPMMDRKLYRDGTKFINQLSVIDISKIAKMTS